ncbi:MAG: tetratricopeptide repeat protein [Candidatus Dependentiae bacterium]|nr:tetratricopeptide repeat protein [Candidatus Dependentiae bacterium]
MKRIIYSLILWAISTAPLYAVTTQTIHNYLTANRDQFSGKMKQAYDRYKILLSEKDVPLHAYKGYIHLLHDTGNYEHVEQLIPELDPLFKNDQSIQLIFAQSLDKLEKHNQADERFIKLNDEFKNNQEIAFNATNSYLRRKEPENAIKVIDNLLNSSANKPNNFIFYFMKSQIYMQLNNKVEALNNVQKCLDMHPRFEKGWLLYALLNEQAGELKGAIKGYTNFLETSGGDNKDVEQHLLQLVFKQKIEQRATNNSLTMNKQCFDGALTLFDQKNYKQALVKIDACLQEKPDSNESKLLKIQILTAMKQMDAVAATLQAWILKDPTNTMWYKTVHLLTQDVLKFEQAVKILQEVEKQQPNNLLPKLYLADLNTRFDKNEAALNYHQKSLKLAPSKALKSKILYQISILQYEAKNFDALKKTIEETKKINSTFAPLLNLIAYYYATEGDNIKEAEKLIKVVLKQDATNPHFQDTQALIYHKQKNYTQALTLLQNVAQKIPSDYTVLIHLAQTLYESGNTNNALTTLEQAKRNAKTKDHNLECAQLLNQWKTKKT